MDEDDPLEDFKPREITPTTNEEGVCGGRRAGGHRHDGDAGHQPTCRSASVAGFATQATVYMPSLFGRDGAVPTVEEGKAISKRACVSADSGPSLPISQAQDRRPHRPRSSRTLSARSRRSGIGMGFTRELRPHHDARAVDVAPVLSQLSLPLNDPAGLDIAPDELAEVRRTPRAGRSDRHGLSFRGRSVLPGGAVRSLLQHLVTVFIARVLPDSAANPDTPPSLRHDVARPQSAATAHLIDEQASRRSRAPTKYRRSSLEAFRRRSRSNCYIVHGRTGSNRHPSSESCCARG